MSVQSDVEFRNLHGWPGTCVVFAATGSSVQSAALTAGKTYWFSCPIGVHIECGSNPTAVVATSFFIAAGVPFPITVPAAGGKVAVIKHLSTDTNDVAYMAPETGTGC